MATMRSSIAGKMGLVALASLSLLATSVWADGFNPKLSPLPVIGESLVCSSSGGGCSAADAITVDWAVGLVSPGVYEYMYGVETDTSTDVASWEIDFAPGSITSDGFVSGTTLDSAALSTFGLSLGPEDEGRFGGPINPQSVSPTSPGPSTDHATWGFDNPTTGAHTLLSGDQSSVLVVFSPFPPVFGFGSGSDSGGGGSPWNTNAPGANPVPVPWGSIPEPASMILLGSALFGLAAIARRLLPTH